jgi:hypothetical protein
LAYNPRKAVLADFEGLTPDVYAFSKVLKIKAFISEKSLDTPVFGLIRFRQKVLTESKASVGTILP